MTKKMTYVGKRDDWEGITKGKHYEVTIRYNLVAPDLWAPGNFHFIDDNGQPRNMDGLFIETLVIPIDKWRDTQLGEIGI